MKNKGNAYYKLIPKDFNVFKKANESWGIEESEGSLVATKFQKF
jgi:hypothetical protein